MDLANCLLIDVSTGTVLCPQHCTIVTSDTLSDQEWDDLDNMSDSETAEIGRVRGQYLQELIP